jgi:hypothetical protein
MKVKSFKNLQSKFINNELPINKVLNFIFGVLGNFRLYLFSNVFFS